MRQPRETQSSAKVVARAKMKGRRSSNETANSRTFSILAFKSRLEHDIANTLQIPQSAVFVESFLPWADDKSALLVSFFQNQQVSGDRDANELSRDLTAKIMRLERGLALECGQPSTTACPLDPLEGADKSALHYATHAMMVEDSSLGEREVKVRIIMSGDYEQYLSSSCLPAHQQDSLEPQIARRHSTGTCPLEPRVAGTHSPVLDGDLSAQQYASLPSPPRSQHAQLASGRTQEISNFPRQKLLPHSSRWGLRGSTSELPTSSRAYSEESLADLEPMRQAIAASRACRERICSMLNSYGVKLELHDLASGY